MSHKNHQIFVALILSLFLFSVLVSFAQTSTAPTDPRSLPSLLIRWEQHIDAESAVLADNVLYVQGKGHIWALDTRDGLVLWDTPCIESEQRWHVDLLLFEDTLVGSNDRELCLVDRHSGTLQQRINAGGSIFRTLGPPLIADIIPDDIPKQGSAGHHHVVRIDHRTGRVLARRDMNGLKQDLVISEGVIQAIVRKTSQTYLSIIGLRADDLTVLWERQLNSKIIPRFYQVAGQTTVNTEVKSGSDARFIPIDPLTGALGPVLPVKASTGIQTISADQSRNISAQLKRINPTTGELIWSAQLPGTPHAWIRSGDRLIVHCGGFPGRGYLVALDWKTGLVSTVAYGLRGVRELFLVQNFIIARSNTEVVAFETNKFGPPEVNLRPVQNEVRRIISADGKGEPYFRLGPGEKEAAVIDLKALGPEALPFLADEIPALGQSALAVAAHVLGDASFRPAAPAFAGRFQGLSEEPIGLSEGWNTQMAVLRALSNIGGSAEVPIVAELLKDRSRQPTIRRQALAALASIGTPEAVAVIEAFLPKEIQQAPSHTEQSPDLSLPKVILPPAKGEEQEAAQAAFQQFFLFDGVRSSKEPIIVVSDFDIEWPGRIGPTMTLPEAEARRARREEILIFIRSGVQRVGGKRKEPRLAPDERVFSITLDRGFLVGYNVIVRKLAGQWVIKDVKFVWIS